MIPMNCANCGAMLEITKDMELFACGHCGTQQRVERKGGTVSLQMVETAIKAVQRGTDRTAAELALPRLMQELAQLEAERKLKLEEEKQAAMHDWGWSMKGMVGKVFVGLVVFVVSIVAWLLLSALFGGLGWSALIVLVAIGLIFPHITRRPQHVAAINKEFDDRAGRLRDHIVAHRKMLDQLP